ncbi:MAG: CNP1-like family protein [Halochromatium sp.]
MPKPIAFLALLTLAASAGAEESPFVYGPEEVVPKSVKPGAKWQEGPVSLPAWPVALGTGTALALGASLATGRDEVVRYTLVAESRAGARNLTFEGLRCTPKGAFRIYAFGQDRRFKAARSGDDWQMIGTAGTDPVRYELWRHYLCIPRLFEPRPTRDQLRMLRSGRVPDTENSGFLSH